MEFYNIFVLKAILRGTQEASERTRRGWLKRKRAVTETNVPVASDGTPITKPIRDAMLKLITESSDDSGFAPHHTGKYMMMPDGSFRFIEARAHPQFVQSVFSIDKRTQHMHIGDAKSIGVARVTYVGNDRPLFGNGEKMLEMAVEAKWLSDEQRRSLREFLKIPDASIKLERYSRLPSKAGEPSFLKTETFYFTHDDPDSKLEEVFRKFDYNPNRRLYV